MNPTLIYNNYYVQRRKMFQNSPRSNLYSTVDITWRQSVEKELSPKEKMEKRKEAERKMVGERSNELIAKRLKIQVFVDSQLWKSIDVDMSKKDNKGEQMIIDSSNRNMNDRRSSSLNNGNHNRNITSNSLLNNQMKDTLNQQVQNYLSSNKLLQHNSLNYNNLRNRQQENHQPFPHNNNTHHTLIPTSHNRYTNYTKHFDPELQSLASRQSMANSELSALIPKGNSYLSNFLNKKLEKYLLEGKNRRDGNFYDLETIENSDR